jgi:hypothetical protein
MVDLSHQRVINTCNELCHAINIAYCIAEMTTGYASIRSLTGSHESPEHVQRSRQLEREITTDDRH